MSVRSKRDRALDLASDVRTWAAAVRDAVAADKPAGEAMSELRKSVIRLDSELMTQESGR